MAGEPNGRTLACPGRIGAKMDRVDPRKDHADCIGRRFDLVDMSH